MFTIDCEDPNCMECKQASKEQSSKEGNESIMQMAAEESPKGGNQSQTPESAGPSSKEEVKKKLMSTIEEVIAGDLHRAHQARFLSLAKCHSLKKGVSREINELIDILKQRERDLLATIEGEFYGQVSAIDSDLTSDCVAKILNKCDKARPPCPRPSLIYSSDFPSMKQSLSSFGRLTVPNTQRPRGGRVVTGKQMKDISDRFKTANLFCGRGSSAALSLKDPDAETPTRAKNAEFDAAALAELQNETEKTFKEVNRVSEKVSHDLKEIGEVIDSRIKLPERPIPDPSLASRKKEIGEVIDSRIKFPERPPPDPPLTGRKKTLDEMTRELYRICYPNHIGSFKEPKSREEHPFFCQYAPKLNEDLKIIVEDKVSESPQTMSLEERRRRRELHVLKVREEREKHMNFSKKYQESLVPQAEVNNTSGSKRMKDFIPGWPEILKNYKKDVQCAPKKDDPETLSGQIEKRIGAINRNYAHSKTLEDQRRMEAKKNDSLEWTEDLRKLVIHQPQVYEEYGTYERIDLILDKEPINYDLLKKGFSEKIQAEVEFVYGPECVTSSESSDSTVSSSSEEDEKESSLDEEDMVIISRLEAESIPSDVESSPPLPPKRQFKLGGRPSCFASLLRKKANRKPDHSPINSAKSESSDIVENESQKSSSSGARSSGSNTEVKENPTFQESSSQCLDGSTDVGPGNNPTLALRSSLAKYLEKNPESEWLANGKSSESAENSTKTRVVPLSDQELEQWLPAGFNRRKELARVAKWRPTDCDWLFNADE